MSSNNSRRQFLKTSSTLVAAAGVYTSLPKSAFAIVTSESERPKLMQGIQIGDVTANNGMIWSRADRAARMLVEYSYHQNFKNSQTIRGPYAMEKNDFTSRVDLSGLKADREVFVRVSYQDLTNDRVQSEATEGSFITAPAENTRDIHFLWSGDTAGQGWGINEDFGGMKIYESMRLELPDFFIHSGDTIYADGPISEFQEAEDGSIWKNVVTEEVSKVAETLAEYRGRYKYNLLDENIRRFNAEVAQIWQWDDHEVVNNWSGSKDLNSDNRFTEKDIPTLVARGTTAFLEYSPMRPFDAREKERIYRHVPYGPLLDTFVLDMRSYRGPNSSNDQTELNEESQFMGPEQLEWLKSQLLKSESVWKIIAADMPIGLMVRDGDYFENLSNGDGEPMGRELEIVDLLRFIKRNRIKNVVWITADVHYCAAHYYNPDNAVFQDFEPFWEFVSGPLNAGSFGPNDLDNTFGPEVVFQKAPAISNSSPLAGFQFYGDIKIDQYSAEMIVSLKDIDGIAVYSQTLTPERQKGRAYGHEVRHKHKY